MRFRWEPDGPGIDQFLGLSDDAALFLVATMDDLVEDPWAFGLPPGDVVDKSKVVRTVLFGGQGTATIMIYEPHPDMNEDFGLVLITDITWAD